MNQIRRARDYFSAQLGSLESPKARSFARFIRQGDPGAPVPCWGALSRRFAQDFPSDKERLELLKPLIEAGDRRPLLLFVQHSRDRPALLKALCEGIDALPDPVQCAILALPEASTHIAEQLHKLSPAARQVWEGGATARARELERFSSRVATLMAFDYFVPDSIDPARERERR